MNCIAWSGGRYREGEGGRVLSMRSHPYVHQSRRWDLLRHHCQFGWGVQSQGKPLSVTKGGLRDPVPVKNQLFSADSVTWFQDSREMACVKGPGQRTILEGFILRNQLCLCPKVPWECWRVWTQLWVYWWKVDLSLGSRGFIRMSMGKTTSYCECVWVCVCVCLLLPCFCVA